MILRLTTHNQSNRNSKGSKAFDGAGIKRVGQSEARFPHILSQITLKLVPFLPDPILSPVGCVAARSDAA